MSPLRILLVDDHLLFRKGLARLLDAQPDFEVVGEAADGLEAVEQARRLRPDVVLMDVAMPSSDGLEALHRIKTHLPQVQVVVLTVSDSEEDLASAIRYGADGYLLKDVQPEVLFQQLRGLGAGEAPLSRSLTAKVLRLLQRQLERASQPATVLPLAAAALTPRESQVLALLVDGASNAAIARELGIAHNTVKNHLRSILRKLGVRNRAQAVARALREGLVVLCGQPPAAEPQRRSHSHTASVLAEGRPRLRR
jgi:two-component system nitrate/nitrite response regulator NarL